MSSQSLNQGGIPRDRPEEIGFSDIVMIQPILCRCLKMVSVEIPTVKGNRDAKLILFIPLAVQRSECKTLAIGKTEPMSLWPSAAAAAGNSGPRRRERPNSGAEPLRQFQSAGPLRSPRCPP